MNPSATMPPAPTAPTARDLAREWERAVAEAQEPKPIVTTLVGSTRFPEAFQIVTMHLTLAGRIVIPPGLYGHADLPTGGKFLCSDGDEFAPVKQQLDTLHYRKIDISDGIYVVNVGFYIGNSTRREINYAHGHHKTVEYLFDSGSGIAL